MNLSGLLLCCILPFAPLLAQSSKETKKSAEQREVLTPKKTDAGKSGSRGKIKASSGDETGTAKGTVTQKK